MKCPLCNSATQVGRIGRKLYYCHLCYLEWSEKTEQIQVFRISENGRLVRINYSPALASA